MLSLILTEFGKGMKILLKLLLKIVFLKTLIKGTDKLYPQKVHQFLLKDLSLKTYQGRFNMDFAEEDVG